MFLTGHKDRKGLVFYDSGCNEVFTFIARFNDYRAPSLREASKYLRENGATFYRYKRKTIVKTT